MARLQAELSKYEEMLCDPEIDPDEMNKVLEKMGDAQTQFGAWVATILSQFKRDALRSRNCGS